MKKFILGCVLLLAGVIGFSNWVIACTNDGVGRSTTLAYLHGSDWAVALLFIAMSIIGLVIALIEIKNDR